MNPQNPQPTVSQTFTGILGTSVTTNENGNITETDSDEVSFENDNEVQHLDVPEATITPVIAGKRVVKINLAWLILVIPGGILLLTLRALTRKIIKRLP